MPEVYGYDSLQGVHAWGCTISPRQDLLLWRKVPNP